MTRPIVAIIGGTHPFARAGRGGHETFVIATAEAAARAGYETHVFVLGSSPALEPRTNWTLHTIRTPVRPIRTMFAAAHAPFCARSVADALEQLGDGPFVIHAIGAWAALAASVRAMLRKRGRDASLVASVYTTLRHEVGAKLRAFDSRVHHQLARVPILLEYAWIHVLAERVERRSYRAADLLLVNYAAVAALLAPLETYPPVRTIAYASTDAFADADVLVRATAARPVRIGVVARHDPRKGLDRLIRALAMLAAENIPFTATLAGRGPLLDDHRALATRLGVAGRIAFPGFVADAFACLREHDIYVLPSLEEGSGSVAMLEAMQAGCAIVASDIDGIPEDIRNGIDGLLVPADDVDALRAALEALITDETLRARLAAAARSRFEQRFSAAALVSDLRAAYGSVSAERAGISGT